ncbi:hydrolase [Burkholderia lata]|nr:hydrolase [Burkholderia lata]
MSKPAIVLVHGFWGGAAHWAKVIVELARKVITLDASHASLASKPVAVAALIDEAATALAG